MRLWPLLEFHVQLTTWQVNFIFIATWLTCITLRLSPSHSKMSRMDGGGDFHISGMANESDPERVTELESGSDDEKPFKGRGRFNKGRWYCDCNDNVEARCRTAGRKAKPENRGRKYWSCSKNERESCEFFLWVDDERRAKDWHREKGFLSGQETPPPKKLDWSVNPFSLSTKRKSSKNVSFSSDFEEAGPANEDNEPPESPSRKATKVNRHSTPGQTSPTQPQAPTIGLPTPQSERQSNGESSSAFRHVNGTNLAAAIDLGDEEHQSDLVTAVMKILRSENVELKGSTELQIEHELGLVTARHDAEIGRYKKTISKLSKRCDELENLVICLGGVVAIDEEVEFSD